MLNISIISSSIRAERNSHRVALYFKSYLEDNNVAAPCMLDLRNFNFPIFDNTLKAQKTPTEGLIDFAQKIKSSDAVIIVTPEYNGSYPASLKNAIDALYEEWTHKPIAIATVSAGPFGGSQALVALQFTLWKMKAWTVPAMFSVPYVQNGYDVKGNPVDKAATDKLAAAFIQELLCCVDANTEARKVAGM